jgi:YhcH/YjgK/YiaL family protein
VFAALQFLVKTDLNNLPIGRTEIDGDRLFALVQEYDTKPAEQGIWEAHRKYIDVQYMVTGQERMGFAHLSAMQLGEYVPEKDFQPMSGVGNSVNVFAGAFVIFFPQDGHMPGLCIDVPEKVKKVVLKVRIEEAG